MTVTCVAPCLEPFDAPLFCGERFALTIELNQSSGDLVCLLPLGPESSRRLERFHRARYGALGLLGIQECAFGFEFHDEYCKALGIQVSDTALGRLAL